MTTSTIVLDKVETLVIESGGPLEAIVTENNNTVVVQSESTYAIVAGTIGPNSVATMDDVDLTNLADGSLLIYKVQTNKWTAGNLLEKHVIEAGQY
jgi:hypothetical protein